MLDPISNEIVDRLQYAMRRDIKKNGASSLAGLRSTTDIHDYFVGKVSVATVRARLNSLAHEGIVDCYGKIEGLGNAHWWRIATNDNNGGGEKNVSAKAA